MKQLYDRVDTAAGVPGCRYLDLGRVVKAPILIRAVIWMNLALVFYTWAVFSGRRQGLHTRHLIIFGMA